MNKPSIKYIRLNDGDVISTSGTVSSYWKMENCGDNIPNNMKFTSPEGEEYNNAGVAAMTAHFSIDEGTLASTASEIAGAENFNFYGEYIDGLSNDFNGDWTYNSSSNIFTKVN